MQIEHHLFPAMIHTRLPEIADIVRTTCEEFGLKYYAFDTFLGAAKSNVDLLYKLGRKPREYELADADEVVAESKKNR